MTRQLVETIGCNMEDAATVAEAQAVVFNVEERRRKLQEKILSPRAAVDLVQVQTLDTFHRYEQRARKRRMRAVRRLIEGTERR